MATITTFELSPRGVRLCPGKTATLAISVLGSNLSGVQLSAVLRDGSPAPAGQRVVVKKRTSSRLEGELVVEAGQDVATYQIEVVCAAKDGTLVGRAPIEVEVRWDINLRPSSLKLNEKSLSGSIQLDNCSAIQPRVHFRLVCHDGDLVVESTIDAKVAVSGTQSFELKFRDDRVTLGSCRLEALDEDGNVLDSTSLRQAAPRSVPILPKLLVGAGAIAAVIVVIILFVAAGLTHRIHGSGSG